MIRKNITGIILIILFAAPVAIVIVKSFDQGLTQYTALFGNGIFIRSLLYTVIITVINTVINLLISLIMGYCLANRDIYLFIKAAPFIIFVYLTMAIMPFQITLLPNYIITKKLFIYNSSLALILPNIFAPFGTFYIYQCLKTLPNYTIEAARLDTCGSFTILFRIILPQIKVCGITLLMIEFANNWNMVDRVLYLTTDDKYRTVGTLLNNTQFLRDISLYAGSVVYILPIIILYVVFYGKIHSGFQYILF